MQGELKMLINLRNNAGKLVVKDILDIDFDMSVEEKNNSYIINVNRQYRCSEEYDNEKDAESRMLQIAEMRNDLETELRNC